MLLDLTVENFRSIYEPASINLVATKEQAHRERCPQLVSRYRKTVNPVAALFGANAAGKSTFVRALHTLKWFVIDPPRSSESMPYQPFGLREGADREPTGFELLFSHDDFIYEYILRYDAHEVVEERLTKYFSNNEVDIYERVGSSFTFAQLDQVANRYENEAVQARMLLESVPPKTPLASFASEANLTNFPEALQLHNLGAVTAFLRSVFVVPAGIMDRAQPESVSVGWKDVITQIDAGITGVELKEIPISALGVDAEHVQGLERILRGKEGTPLEIELPAGRFALKLEDGEIKAERVTLQHVAGPGQSRSLEWWDESDGTRSAARLIGLFSALALGIEMVLVVDELDRSFHTELSRALIAGFLASSNKATRAQLVFTTHDLLLMDPEMLRRDEIWVLEKDRFGQTRASALSEFQGPRKVTDLRKSYLRGRFGGVPSIKPLEFNRGE